MARAALAERGVRLVLDLVPNHVAPDHPWVRDASRVLHPRHRGGPRARTRRVHRDRRQRARLRAGPVLPGVAGGAPARCFPSRRARARWRRWSSTLTERCDGVRCDMAMLVLDDVFSRTWGERATGARPTRAGLLAARSSARPRRRVPTSCCGPRRTGTSNRCSSTRASTPATTSGSTTASCMARRRRRRAGPSRRRRGLSAPHCCGSSRTTTNRGRRRCSRPAHRAALTTVLTLPGVGARCTRARPMVAASASRSRSVADRSRRPIGELRRSSNGSSRGGRGCGAGEWALVDGRGLARQPERRAAAGLDVDRPESTPSRRREPERRACRRPGAAAVGRPRRPGDAGRPPVRHRYERDGNRSWPTASTSRSTPTLSTCSTSPPDPMRPGKMHGLTRWSATHHALFGWVRAELVDVRRPRTDPRRSRPRHGVRGGIDGRQPTRRPRPGRARCVRRAAAGRAGDAASTIELLAAVGGPATMGSTGPNYFGFVNGATIPVALGAAFLVTALGPERGAARDVAGRRRAARREPDGG